MEELIPTMKAILNRRQFGKHLLAGSALALANPGTSTSAEAAAQKETAGRWQLVAPGTWKVTTGLPETTTPVTSRLVPLSVKALDQLPSVPNPLIEIPISNISRRGTALIFSL